MSTPLPENLKPRLKASYDAIAETYNAWAGKSLPVRLAQLDRFLARFVAELAPAPDAPQEGRGGGPRRRRRRAPRARLRLRPPVAARLLEAAPRARLTANDLSATQVALARANLLAALARSPTAAGASAEEALAARVAFEAGDMMALSFPPRSLAGVVGFYSLIHLPRAEQAELVGRVYGWLAPGGLLVANFAAEEMESSIVEKWLKHEDGWMFWSSWGAEGTIKVFEDVGFEILSKEIKEDVVDASFLWLLARKKA